jgi:hypothetical protein
MITRRRILALLGGGGNTDPGSAFGQVTKSAAGQSAGTVAATPSVAAPEINEWLSSVFPEWCEWRVAKGACPSCLSREGFLYEPATEEVLPPEDCTCEGGCRSQYFLVPYPPESDV